MQRQQQYPAVPQPSHSTPHTSPFHMPSTLTNGIPPPLHNHSTPFQQDRILNHTPNAYHRDHTPKSSPSHPHSISTPPTHSPQLGNSPRMGNSPRLGNSPQLGNSSRLRPPISSGGRNNSSGSPLRNGGGIPLPRLLHKQNNPHVARTLL